MSLVVPKSDFMHNILYEISEINKIIDTYEIPSGEDDCKNKINDISEIKEKIMELQINKSFLPKNIMVYSDDLSSDDIDSIRKYIKNVRYYAYLKRNTIKRLNHALASYKLAYIYYKTGAMQEFLNHLPYDGNLLKNITKEGSNAASLYYNIHELICGEIEQIGISLLLSIKENGEIRHEKIRLYNIKNIDDYIHEKYGNKNSVEVIKTKIITKNKSIVSSKAYEKVIAYLYAIYTIRKKGDYLIDVKSEKLDLYRNILKTHGIKNTIKIDLYDDLKGEIIDEMEESKLIHFENGKLIMDEELNEKLNEYLIKRNWEYLKFSYMKISKHLIKFIILTTANIRRNLGIFTFDDDISIIKPIIDKASLHKLNKPYEMVLKKIEIEEELGGNKKIGLAVFAHYQGKKITEEWFNIKINEIKNEINLVESYLKGDLRGEKFLEQFK
jgi:hypothetical protein